MRLRYVLSVAAGISMAACGDDGPAALPVIELPNTAPVFSVSASGMIAENETGGVFDIVVSDAEGDTFTLALSGPDAAVFTLDDDDGDGDGFELELDTALDFEAPVDADSDNVYDITLTASDDEGASAMVTIALTVTDEVEAFIPVTGSVQIGSGFVRPVQTVALPGDTRLLIVQQGGRIDILDPATGSVETVPFLDVSAEVSSGNEQGLLGLTFSPDFATDRTVFLNMTNISSDTEIRRYQTFAGTQDQADPATADTILIIAQPFGNHNAGWLGFDNDGFLLIPTGDGGGAGDPQGNAQDLTTLLGKVLRIDVSGDDFPSDPNRDYAIPASNPFAAGGGAPEILALGLRNPYRASLDEVTGELYIGDVGQALIEEVDRFLPGNEVVNFGWNRREGSQPFNNGANDPSFTEPIIDYDHGSGPLQGNSIVGGVVYRGSITALDATYVFGDTISSNVWSVPLSALVDGMTVSGPAFVRLTDLLAPDTGSIDTITSFDLDLGGNLLITDLDGEIYRVSPPP